MPICALQLPIVKIFKDYDKMSAKEQYESSEIDGDDIETDDERVTIKFVAASIDEQDCCNSSNEEDMRSLSKSRPMRQRKRSTSNIFHKPNKAHSDLHTPDGSAALNSSCESIGAKRVNSPANLYIGPLTSTPTSSTGLRKHLLVRRSPSPLFLRRTPDREQSTYNGNPPTSPLNMCPGYVQYQMSLLEVPMPRDYGDASSDDLSSEWDSDVQEPQRSPKVFIIFYFFLLLPRFNKINHIFFYDKKKR